MNGENLKTLHRIDSFMKFKNPKIEKLYEYLSQMSRRAYFDPLLIVNDVLCKHDTRGRILETCISGKTPQKVTFFLAVKKILFYFVKNLVAYLGYLVTAMAHRFSRQSFRVPGNGELLVLDTYFWLEELLRRIDSRTLFSPAWRRR